jgi:molybdopterin converting factor small subunit
MAIHFYQFSLTKDVPFSVKIEKDSMRLGDLLDMIDRDYNVNLNARIHDKENYDTVDPNIVLSVNGIRVSFLDNFNTIVKDGDEVTVGVLLAGG